ncbi:Chloroplastic group IIB intron splicing facilitator CRS2-B, chloroplastic [Linum grandiflorum]
MLMLQATTASTSCISCPRLSITPRSRLASSSSSSTSHVRIRASSTGYSDGLKVEYTPWLIVGLGNPGNKYHGTRHNVGFEVVDRIAETHGVVLNTIQSKAVIGIGCVGEVPILLAKPQAYMNFSGESVSSSFASSRVSFERSGLDRLLHTIKCPSVIFYWYVFYGLEIYDEMSLPNGVMRLQPKGGHGHHNGVKSVIDHLDGCRQFPRLCIGIGNPPGTMDMKAFLLQRFSPTERTQIDIATEQGVEAVTNLVLNGFTQQITRFNLSQKYKYHKV